MQSEFYLVYGDGYDYIVVDGIWADKDDAAERAAFLNQLSGDVCESHLCLSWTYEEIPVSTVIRKVPSKDDDGGWILK